MYIGNTKPLGNQRNVKQKAYPVSHMKIFCAGEGQIHCVYIYIYTKTYIHNI